MNATQLSLLASAVAACLLPSAVLAQVSFTPIGDLAGGGTFSTAWGVSGDGRWVVGASGSINSGLLDDAFRFRRSTGVLSTLTTMPVNNDLPGGLFQSTALGVNLDGSVIVGASVYEAARVHAFSWSLSSTLFDLGGPLVGIPPPPELDFSAANAVADNGHFGVGYAMIGSPPHRTGCWWTPGTPGGYPMWGDNAESSEAFGISGSGHIAVGQVYTPIGSQAFAITTGSDMFRLGDAEGGTFDSCARDCSTTGAAIVGYCTTAAGREAAMWTGNGIPIPSNYTLRPLGDLPGGAVWAVAYACSADARIIVGSSDAGRLVEAVPATDAFVRDPNHGLRSLAEALGAALPVGWFLDTATGISNDGTVIVGTGTNPLGVKEGYVATLPRFCLADMNGSGGVSVQDIFDFLAAYFGDSLRADVNVDNTLTIQDVFDFLAAYFAGCP
jgi:probable HAF family extracellular repeat protein